MHSLRKRLLYKIGGGSLIILALLQFIPRQMDDSLNNEGKIQLIERSIRSAMNRDECHQPDLPIDNPEIMKFYKQATKINCGNSLDDWVMCEKSICFVKPEISSSHGEVVCSYTDLIRKNDYSSKYGKTTRTKEPYVLQKSDFVKVVCSAANGERWFGMAYGIRDTVQRSIPNIPPPAPRHTSDDTDSYPLYNVLIFGFDSLSRNAFMRKLPKSYKYLVGELNAIVLKGYNIIGDGTPQALIPLLTGYTELELPETRARVRNSGSVNAYPMIWNEYAKQGYVTSFNEDIPKYGTFTYRMSGFETQPVDHYLRTFYVEVENILSSSKKHCIGNQPAHMVMLDYTRNFMNKYSDNPRFVFSFHGDLSHDSTNLIGTIDDDVVQWLHQLRSKSLLNNTILISMADHGSRYSKVRNTLQGKQEERLPFFSFVFPASFKKRFPQQYQNFKANSEKLSTPFDVHATLAEILTLQRSDLKSLPSDPFKFYDESTQNEGHYSHSLPEFKTNAPNRAISLFKHIPKNRSCADAYIEPHWCACLKWRKLSLNDSTTFITAQKMAQSVLSTINEYTSQYRYLCEILELKEINWAMRLNPRKEMLNFKKNKDTDGYIADLTNDMKMHEELYQLQIAVSPGNALFEASVQYDLQTFVANTRISQISRVNKYGTQANCIYDRNPELRKYCNCKT